MGVGLSVGPDLAVELEVGRTAASRREKQTMGRSSRRRAEPSRTQVSSEEVAVVVEAEEAAEAGGRVVCRA